MRYPLEIVEQTEPLTTADSDSITVETPLMGSNGSANVEVYHSGSNDGIFNSVNLMLRDI
ncbi:MAG: hypothetical protein J5724_02015 [Ruminococcus sp.]|nr:hypothetical protein [Ruminococcus sp.]